MKSQGSSDQRVIPLVLPPHVGTKVRAASWTPIVLMQSMLRANPLSYIDRRSRLEPQPARSGRTWLTYTALSEVEQGAETRSDTTPKCKGGKRASPRTYG
jgi:hypothetical protein